MDTEIHCRLCLTRANVNVDIFNIAETEINIALILSKHLGLTVTPDDLQSKELCSSCWYNVHQFHTFYVYVHDVQSKNNHNIWENGTDNDGIHFDKFEEEPRSQFEIKGKSIAPGLKQCNLKDIANNQHLSTDSTLAKDDAIKIPCHSARKNRNRRRKNAVAVKNVCKNMEDEKIVKFFSILPCQRCSANFKTLSSLKIHYLEQHQMHRGYVLCCNRKIATKTELYDHVILHENPEAFKCPKCNTASKDRKRLQSHMLNVHEDKPYECNECGKRYQMKTLLRDHLLSRHLSDENKKFICKDYCGKIFGTSLQLKKHLKIIHPVDDNRQVMCDICARVFNSQSSLKKHCDSNHAAKKPKIPCSQCPTWLRDERSLKRHISIYHSSNKPPERCKCSACGKLLANQKGLEWHIRTVHSARSHQCHLCSKSFYASIKLKDHLATHTGHRKYPCAYCSATFKAMNNFYTHRKQAHPAEWARDRALGLVSVHS